MRKLTKINKIPKLQKSIANNAMKPRKTTPKLDLNSQLDVLLGSIFVFIFHFKR